MNNHDLMMNRLGEIIQKEESLKEVRDFGNAQKLYTDWIKEVLEDKEVNISRNSDSRQREQDSLNESIALAFNNRGQLKYLAVDFDGAVEDYDKALEYNSSLPSAYYNRGTIAYRMGYFDKAVKDMTIALELAPHCEEFSIALKRCKDELTDS